jgi:uncharacterized membrane protein
MGKEKEIVIPYFAVFALLMIGFDLSVMLDLVILRQLLGTFVLTFLPGL